LKQIPHVTLENVSRAMNGRADALARVAKELSEPGENKLQITIRNRRPLSIHTTKLDEEIEEIKEGKAKMQLV
jgi:hypothetical protein